MQPVDNKNAGGTTRELETLLDTANIAGPTATMVTMTLHQAARNTLSSSPSDNLERNLDDLGINKPVQEKLVGWVHKATQRLHSGLEL